MRKRVPAPPTPSFERSDAGHRGNRSTPAAAKRRIRLSAPLDDGFLGRTYVTSLWVGALFAMIAYGQTNSLQATGSFVGGIALGALLLKSQEIFVRRVMSSETALRAGRFARFALMLLLGLKFGFIMALMGLTMEAGWLQPGAFVLGFFTQQLIIVAKVTGRFLSLNLRSVGEESSESWTSQSNLKPKQVLEQK